MSALPDTTTVEDFCKRIIVLPLYYMVSEVPGVLEATNDFLVALTKKTVDHIRDSLERAGCSPDEYAVRIDDNGIVEELMQVHKFTLTPVRKAKEGSVS